MGSWNYTCAVSSLPIFEGDPVYGFLVNGDRAYRGPEAITLPLLGVYDSYGSMTGYDEPAIEKSWKEALSTAASRFTKYPKFSFIPDMRRFDHKDVTMEQLLAKHQDPVYLCLVRKEVWEALLGMTSHGEHPFDPEEETDPYYGCPTGLGVPWIRPTDGTITIPVVIESGTLPLARYRELIFVTDMLYTLRKVWHPPAYRGSSGSYLDDNLKFFQSMASITEDLISSEELKYEEE